jgi:PGF-CTERM protein
MLQNGEWVSMPTWLKQGIPEYVAMYHTTEGIRNSQFDRTEEVRNMIARDSGYLMSISQKPYKSRPLVVEYIVDEYGWDAVMGLIRTEHSNAAPAFESNLGVSVRKFQDGWVVHAGKQYGGDCPRAEARLSDTDAPSTEDLLVRLDSKNETIEELRARLAAQNETVDEQDETIAGLRDPLQNQSDGAATTDAPDPAETTDTPDSSTGASSPGFGPGAGLVSLLAAGTLAIGRRGS